MSFAERARAVKAMYRKAKSSPKYSIVQVSPFRQMRVPTSYAEKLRQQVQFINGDQNANPYLQIRHPLAPQGDPSNGQHRRASQAPHSSPDNSGAGSPQGPSGAQAGGRANPYTSVSGGAVYSLAGQLGGIQAWQYSNANRLNNQGPQAQMGYLGNSAMMANIGANPVVPPGDLKVGEIVGWRSWKVAYEKEGLRLRSLYWGNLWKPGEPMIGCPWANTEGVYAWKNKDAAEEYGCMSLAGMSLENGTMIVLGQVDLWGVVDEYTSGYRAEYGAIKSLDAVLGERKFDELLDSLRKTYGVTG